MKYILGYLYFYYYLTNAYINNIKLYKYHTQFDCVIQLQLKTVNLTPCLDGIGI